MILVMTHFTVYVDDMPNIITNGVSLGYFADNSKFIQLLILSLKALVSNWF